jgi:thiamine-monophosphate kinase
MMDVSDGLLLDASRIARASGVTLAIESTAVPIATPEPRRAEALRWGDDYQLLFTMPAGRVPPVPAHAIGSVLAAGDAPLLLDGVALGEADGLGYQHRSAAG